MEKSSSMAEKITVRASEREDSMLGLGGMQWLGGGTQVSSPRPERSSMRIMNLTLFSSKKSTWLACSMNVEKVTRRVAGGLKQA